MVDAKLQREIKEFRIDNQEHQWSWRAMNKDGHITVSLIDNILLVILENITLEWKI